MGIFSSLGFGNKNKDQNKASGYKLTEEQKAGLRKQLERDNKKDFTSEFNRTTGLERSLINQYGMDAVRLIYEDRNSAAYVQLGELPDDCPWHHLNSKNNAQFIDENFAPISSKIPQLLESLKERCRFIYAEKKDEGWDLHYLLDIRLYDGRDYYMVYTGGEPNPVSIPNENLRAFNWTIPDDLAEFYKVHDGFGDLLRSVDLRVMGEMMNPICREQDTLSEGYKFDDLLEFFPDGAGNAQCFYRNEAKQTTNATVDWDHETWEISGESNFFEFIDERMGVLDEE
ncbi:MAG: hypothetical protein JWO44_1410 [Bacteroidetes bacterium]|nr:hypothetical protein [Bacteroidota bacterium]